MRDVSRLSDLLKVCWHASYDQILGQRQDTVVAGHPDAKVIRLEVLRDNAAAIARYQSKGFEIYGGTKSATGTVDVAGVYMDKSLCGISGHSPEATDLAGRT